ncbi:MAG: FAD-dependent oxidoreductase, partial [Brachybacterium tyrofermentans]
MSERTLVVGGGLAGLLAARRHQRAGHRVVLLEAGDPVGGAIADVRIARDPDDGSTSTDPAAQLVLNAGAEAYSIGSGAVDALVAELGLAEQVVSPREGLSSRVVSAAGVHRAPGGSLLGIPGRPLAADVRAVLGLRGALRASLERLLPASVGARPGATVAEVVRTRLGAAVLERLVAPVVGGVHSADPATLEFAAASPQLSAGLAE